ncbi:MAG: CvpA family protein [Planctomycetes bacterium]|nr:CvpA family protein [Planctomycetota bacterium]
MNQQESAPGLLDDAIADLGAAAQGIGLIDGLCLGLIAVFALRGFFRGFVRQAALFAAIFGGISLANLFAEPLAGELPDLTSTLDTGDRLFAAYLAIFLGTLLLAALIARFLETTLDLLQLRSVDRLLGFALGAACGTSLVAFLLACGLVFTPRIGPGEDIHRSLEESRSLRLVADGVVHLRLALPHPFLVHAEEILEQHAHRRAALGSPQSSTSESTEASPEHERAGIAPAETLQPRPAPGTSAPHGSPSPIESTPTGPKSAPTKREDRSKVERTLPESKASGSKAPGSKAPG